MGPMLAPWTLLSGLFKVSAMYIRMVQTNTMTYEPPHFTTFHNWPNYQCSLMYTAIYFEAFLDSTILAKCPTNIGNHGLRGPGVRNQVPWKFRGTHTELRKVNGPANWRICNIFIWRDTPKCDWIPWGPLTTTPTESSGWYLESVKKLP